MADDIQQLRLVRDHREVAQHRNAFFSLTREVFGFTLERWWKAGWWTDDYVCRSLFDGERMVANASTTRMTLHVRGVALHGHQIGTVATLPGYRNRGLCRRLMETIVDELAGEPLFLFANDTVIDFYQRFGFRTGQPEAVPLWDIPLDLQNASRALTQVKPTDPRVVQRVVNHRPPSRRFDVKTAAIEMFHLIEKHECHTYLALAGSVVLIADQRGDDLDVFGLFYDPRLWLPSRLSGLCAGPA